MTPIALLKSMFKPAPSARPSECSRRVRSGDALLIDVREPDEWPAGVAQHAALLPLSDLSGPRAHWRGFLAAAGEREMLLYCRSGARSGTAARILLAEGFRAVNTGGVADWASCGWPVVEPARRIPNHSNAPVPQATAKHAKLQRKQP